MRSQLLAGVLALAITAILVGCGEDVTSPTALEPAPALPAATSLTFRQIDRHASHTCAVANDDRAYCWGSNSQGQLGNGSTNPSAGPSLVAGGLRFRQVSVGRDYSCGVTKQDRVYCWGWNFDGQLGDGTGYPENIRRLSPVPVTGGRKFRQVRAGSDFTCALTPSDSAFCWGRNVFGQLGDGSRITRYAPVRVRGGLEWRQLHAGTSHVCGVTTDDRAYCWGMNFWGQLGDGTQIVPRKPVAVVGGLRFRQISAGDGHSCGVTTGNRAYCWGQAQDGQLGDGSAYPPVLSTWTPVAVATTNRFTHVMAGEQHTCAVTLAGRAFCWGGNDEGAVGNGTRERQPTPAVVAGGLLFTQVSAGLRSTVGLSTAGVAYLWGNGILTPVVSP